MPDRLVKYVFRGDITDLRAKMVAGSQAVKGFADEATKAGREQEKWRRGLTSAGDTAGKFGLVAGAGFVLAVKGAADFDQAMSNVQAATHETAGNMDDLRAAAIKAGADTAFSATEAAGGIEALSKAGVGTADILDGGLTGALNLAAAGSLDVSSAAEIAATTMTQFGLAGDQTSHVADLLAAAAGKAQGEVTDMAQALKYVGPVASQMGISLEETTGVIAELASQGVIGSEAGTALRGMLTSLTSPSKAAANEMAALGIQLYDANGKFYGLDGIAGQLQSTMGNLTAAERDQALGRIFGNEQVTAARILYAGGADAVQGWTKQVDDSGYAAETAAIKMDNLKGDLEQLGGSLETALIGAGDGAQGPLRSLTQNLTKAVNVFNDLPPAAQSSAASLLGITAVTGGAAFFGAKVITGIASTRGALSDIGLTAARSRVALQALGKGVQFVAIIEGVKALDNALAGLTDARLEGDLNRNLSALANGEIVGNLDNMGKYVRSVNSSFAEGQNKAFGWLPGKTEFSEASDEIQKVDEALAQMVESGNADIAAQVMAKIAAQSKEQGIGLAETTKQFDQYNLAVKNTAATAGPVLGPSLQQATEYQELQTAATEEASKALEKAREAANGTAGEFFNLGDSLNDSKVSLGDWIGSLEKQAAALRDFRKNARDAADNGLRKGLIAALQEAGPEGAMRMAQLAGATEKEIRRANRAWKLGQDQIAGYTNEVGGVPASATTTVNVQTGEAIAALNGIQNFQLRDKFITVHTRNTGDPRAPLATGGLVVGPGSGTSDDVPIAASNGEYVMRASSVAKYGVNMMDKINRERFAHGGLVGYAAGGQVKAGRSGVVLDGAYGDLSAKGMKGYLHDLERQLNRTGRSLETQQSALDASTSAVDRETAARDQLVDQFNTLVSDIANQFQTQLFQPAADIWSSVSATGDPIAVLMKDIADSEAFSGLFTGLQARGLAGDSLTAAAQGGTNALETLSAYSDAQLKQYADLYDQRAKQSQAAGTLVAQAQYGQEIAAQNAYLATQVEQNGQLQDLVRELIGKQGEQTQAVNQTTKATELVASKTKAAARGRSRSGAKR